ncbi:STAS domain-containing protein [Streptomyces griseus]|uniref:STAS domain-containing protein n=1 Tax=Streptomyces griseus TaxID=1911 RepID=UPI00068B3909|nr:STAS domain-containing protein [Streptomyces griseus]
MPFPQLTLYRHDRHSRALITLAGEIDLTTERIVRESLGQCVRDGIRAIDVDLTTVTFCDVTGLNAFLHASRATAVAGGSLRLHHPPSALARIIALTGNSTLLHGYPGVPPRPSSPPWTPGAPSGEPSRAPTATAIPTPGN